MLFCILHLLIFILQGLKLQTSCVDPYVNAC